MKRTSHFLLSLLLLAAPVASQAQLTFTTNNGAITITGYTGSGGAVVIPSSTNGYPVTSIGDLAFLQAGLTSVTIPNSVTNIGEDAFYGCSSLTSLTIPSSVSHLGDGAFDYCSGLAGVTIPGNVTNIGSAPFLGCWQVIAFGVDPTNPAYMSSAGVLFNKSQTALVECPGGFHGSYTIPNGVTTVGEAAFDDCSHLTSVTIPSSVTNIGDSAFADCGTLTAINVDSTNPAYISSGGVLFNKSQTTLVEYPAGLHGNYVIPNGVSSIGSWAFNGCSYLTGVTFPSSVTAIGDGAFFYCSGLTGLFFMGNAPSLGGSNVFVFCEGTAYYLPGTSNWSQTFGLGTEPPFGVLGTALWTLPHPLILDYEPSFGVQTNVFSFIISWATNLSVVVEACTNLSTPVWQPLQTNAMPANGWFYFSDPKWTNYNRRFYRLRSSSALTVLGPPIIAIQPTNSSIAVPVGSNVTFSVSVSGTGPFSYQWQLNGTNLPNGIITTVAGNGYVNPNNGDGGYSGDGGAATDAELNSPRGVTMDATGNLFIADSFNNVLRKVGTNRIISTVAGNGYVNPTTGWGGYSGDGGAATSAELNSPSGVAVDATGNLFIADCVNNRIRKVGTNGMITTVAGNGYVNLSTGYGGYSGDGGAATRAELSFPFGVAVDATGNLFIADAGNNVIRKVGTNGMITTVAGNAYGAGTGNGGYSGDGGAATSAELNFPSCVAVDATGNLFIADADNNDIRKVGTNGMITTVAGNGYGAGAGYGGYSGDGGAATNAELNDPGGVVVDATGNLFIADTFNDRIRKVGNNGIITTVAGNGRDGYSGDGGLATSTELSGPWGVAVDATGNLFIADMNNSRIRKVVNPGLPGPTLVLNDVGVGNAGAYDVVVSSPYGSVTSSVVNLTITVPGLLSAPQITVGKTNFTFLLSGPAGSNYVLQDSTDLKNWSSVSTSTIPVSGSINLTNAITGYARRFYRAYLQ